MHLSTYSLYNSETIYYLSSLYLFDLNYLTLYLFRRYLYIDNVQVMKMEFIAAISRVGVALIRSTRGELLCCLVVVLLLFSFVNKNRTL